MLGDYSDVGRFEEATRTSEEAHAARLREFAARAEAVDESGLAEREGLTRGVTGPSAPASADLHEPPISGLATDPVHGLQGTLPLLMGLLAVPDDDVAAAMPAKLAGIGVHFA